MGGRIPLSAYLALETKAVAASGGQVAISPLRYNYDELINFKDRHGCIRVSLYRDFQSKQGTRREEEKLPLETLSIKSSSTTSTLRPDELIEVINRFGTLKLYGTNAALCH